MSAPQITPILFTPPSPFTSATINELVAAGWTPPVWSVINPGFTTPNGGTDLAAIVATDNAANQERFIANVPGSVYRTVTYLETPNDVDWQDSAGNKFVTPAGALMVLEADNGPSAYTPPAPPPISLKAVFGEYWGACSCSDGGVRNIWTANNGTNYPAGVPFLAGTGLSNTLVAAGVGAEPAVDKYAFIEGMFLVEVGNGPVPAGV